MTLPPEGIDKFLRPEELEPPEELEVYSRIEGLLGQEDELLDVPAHERTPHQHRLLVSVSAELDRAAERLRHRAKPA
jgi:hypothetical protein